MERPLPQSVVRPLTTFFWPVCWTVWLVSSPVTVDAADLVGCWEGKWESRTDQFQGTVNAKITRVDSDYCHATFSGRAFKIMPYRYKTLLAVTVDPQTGNARFKSSRKLPLWGQYWVEGYAADEYLVARYRTEDHLGYFIMTRTGCDEPPCSGGCVSGLAPVIPGSMPHFVSAAFPPTMRLGSVPPVGTHPPARTVVARQPSTPALPESFAQPMLSTGAAGVPSNPPYDLQARPPHDWFWPCDSSGAVERRRPSAHLTIGNAPPAPVVAR